jgi:hypothetical protein
MKILKLRPLSAALLLTLLFTMSCSTQDINKIKSSANEVLGGKVPLSNEEIIRGLKEALKIGSANAATRGNKVDAYLKNPVLFIPFPPEAKKAQEMLVSLGQQKLVNDFTTSLNRAAEDAAKEAAPVFANAIAKMTIQDGMAILKGKDDAATQFLKTNTEKELVTKFKPIIEKSLSKVNATKYWSDIINTYNKVPLVTKMNPDLAQYASQKAVAGLFVMLAEEENKIRKDPKARVTEILQKVFANTN